MAKLRKVSIMHLWGVCPQTLEKGLIYYDEKLAEVVTLTGEEVTEAALGLDMLSQEATYEFIELKDGTFNIHSVVKTSCLQIMDMHGVRKCVEFIPVRGLCITNKNTYQMNHGDEITHIMQERLEQCDAITRDVVSYIITQVHRKKLADYVSACKRKQKMDDE